MNLSLPIMTRFQKLKVCLFQGKIVPENNFKNIHVFVPEIYFVHREKETVSMERNGKLPKVSFLLVEDDQKLVGDEIKHNLSHHHQDSAGEKQPPRS